MRKFIYSIVTFGLCLAAQETQAGKYDTKGDYQKVLVQEKTIAFSKEKTFTIRNERGAITLKNWEKPEISVTVELVADIRSKSKLNKVLESAEVNIKDAGWRFSSEASGSFKLKNESYSFNYTIYAPKNLRVDLQTRFGNIWIESIHNNSKIEGEFVSFQLMQTVGQSNDPLQLSLKFADDAQVDYVANLDLKAQFSSIDIEKVDKITTNTQFSKIRVSGKTPLAKLSSQHDKMRWETLEDLVSRKMEFSLLKVEKLLKKLDLDDVSFGKIEIARVAEDFENIRIDAEFTPITIEIGNQAYKFEIETEFGKINLSDGVKIEKKIKDNSELYLKGWSRTKDKGGKVRIRNEHAKIVIK